VTFRIGQKVVRVSSSGETYEHAWLRKISFSYPEIGEVVTIKTINDWPKWTLLTFCEHDNSHLVGKVSKIEPGFGAEHFRPIVEQTTDISIFKKMLKPQGVDA